MLYLTRKVGESIIINNNIQLTITEVRGKGVKIGFEFPKDVSVLRKELFDKIAEQNKEAMTSSADDLAEFTAGLEAAAAKPADSGGEPSE